MNRIFSRAGSYSLHSSDWPVIRCWTSCQSPLSNEKRRSSSALACRIKLRALPRASAMTGVVSDRLIMVASFARSPGKKAEASSEEYGSQDVARCLL
jgi:hypothetical protein